VVVQPEVREADSYPQGKELIMCMLVSLFIGWNVVTFCVIVNQPPPPPKVTPKVILVPVPQPPRNVLYDAEMASLKEI
jgi:hypothetical protein